jgi:hypothetical protein
VGQAEIVPAVPASSAAPVLLLSCGGYRSGSTYLYNLAGEYVERANAGRRIGYLEPSQVPLLESVWSVIEALGVAVAKSHNSPGTAAGADCWPSLLESPATNVLPVCTVRDFRDVLHSFSRMFSVEPEDALESRRWRINLDNLRWWLAAGAVRIDYDDLLTSPCSALEQLSKELGLAPVASVVEDAVAAAAMAVPTSDDRAPAADVADRRTLLHAGHLADPDGGGWRRWPSERLAALRPRLEPVLEEFGYAW